MKQREKWKGTYIEDRIDSSNPKKKLKQGE